MEQEVKVSIICNVYNHELYIRDTLEGFVTQSTNFPFEVLIHDDASTDGSAEIIREYERKYPNIIKPVYQTENQYSQGRGITRTFQLPRAKGKYIAMCEGDDYWTDPLKLQKQYDFMEANPEYALCTCSTMRLDTATGKMTAQYVVPEDRDFTAEEIILEEHGRMFQFASFFAKVEVFHTSPQWFMVFPVGDYPLSVYAAIMGKVRMLSDIMTVYRWNTAGSWTATMLKDSARKKKMNARMIEGLNALNEGTDYRYDAVIKKRIKLIQFNSARMDRDLETMRTGELREIFLSRSLTMRVGDVFWCKAPKLYAFVVKCKKLFRK